MMIGDFRIAYSPKSALARLEYLHKGLALSPYVSEDTHGQ